MQQEGRRHLKTDTLQKKKSLPICHDEVLIENYMIRYMCQYI